MAKINILATKKLSQPLSAQLTAKGFSLTEHDFISVQPVFISDALRDRLVHLVEEDDYIVFTSAHAVNGFTAISPGINTENLKVFCLAGNTLNNVLKVFSEQQVIATANDASSLADKIIAAAPPAVIFCCGDRRRDELPDKLKKSGIRVNELVVYQTVETPLRLAACFDAILFFSPSAVSSYISKNELSKETVCFAIGETTASAIASIATNKIITSREPSQEALVQTVEEYFQPTNN